MRNERDIFLFNKIQWQNNGTRSISFLSPLIQYHLSIFFFFIHTSHCLVARKLSFRSQSLQQSVTSMCSSRITNSNTNFSSDFSIQHSYPVFHRSQFSFIHRSKGLIKFKSKNERTRIINFN